MSSDGGFGRVTRIRGWVRLAFLAFAAIFFVCPCIVMGAWSALSGTLHPPPPGRLSIVNWRGNPVDVSIDGAPGRTVGPGNTLLVPIAAGRHQLHARMAGRDDLAPDERDVAFDAIETAGAPFRGVVAIGALEGYAAVRATYAPGQPPSLTMVHAFGPTDRFVALPADADVRAIDDPFPPAPAAGATSVVHVCRLEGDRVGCAMP